MIPAYKVKPEDLMEVVYATAELMPDANSSDIRNFTNLSKRKVHECIKIGKELDMIKGNGPYNVTNTYQQKISEVSPDNRDVLLNRALIQYRPFRTFGSYVRKGYSVEEAARKTNVVHDIASDADYIKYHFKRLGEYTDMVSESANSTGIEIQDRKIPVNSVESVEALRNSIESQSEIRFYLEETIGSEAVARIDEDTEDELVKAFSDHAETPRDAITAAGRALEDFLRKIAREHGEDTDKYKQMAGAGEVANGLKGDAVIREVHRERSNAISVIRNKGGGHGDDRQTGNRWHVSPEVALTTAMETALLIGSISQHVHEGNQRL